MNADARHGDAAAREPERPARAERRAVLLRLDPALAEALARWAGDEFRSTNAHIELLLRRAAVEAGRLPNGPARPVRRGRPAKSAPVEPTE